MLHPVDMAKTHEILARFRPIAPRPAHPPPPLGDEPPPPPPPHGALQLCAPRPCRARKRGRSQLGNSSSKRQRTLFPLLPAVVPFPPKPASDLLTLSLLPRSPEPDAPSPPVEQDLLRKLQEPRVIAPQPVRPVGSSISVVLISPHAGGAPPPARRRRPEEVEEEVEGDALPAVVSDSRNRVRLANSAYREMVGQPECRWLDAMGMRPRRIGGEVMLDVGEASVPEAAAGFSCSARIEWACDGRKRCVSAPCSVVRLFCESKDYAFAWRFDTSKTCRHCTA